jgi:endonuclease IV
MRSPEFCFIPKILETPKKEDLREDIENMKVLRSLL